AARRRRAGPGPRGAPPGAMGRAGGPGRGASRWGRDPGRGPAAAAGADSPAEFRARLFGEWIRARTGTRTTSSAASRAREPRLVAGDGGRPTDRARVDGGVDPRPWARRAPLGGGRALGASGAVGA